MIAIGNVAAAMDDAREHALPGRAVVAANEVWRRLRDLLLSRPNPRPRNAMNFRHSETPLSPFP
jgi:hypothetical protein